MDDKCQFITGDALIELMRLQPNSVNVIVRSPPYIAKGNVGTGLGSEKNLNEYLGNLITVFHECKRVLRDDGVMWIVIGDTFLNQNVASVPARRKSLPTTCHRTLRSISKISNSRRRRLWNRPMIMWYK